MLVECAKNAISSGADVDVTVVFVENALSSFLESKKSPLISHAQLLEKVPQKSVAAAPMSCSQASAALPTTTIAEKVLETLDETTMIQYEETENLASNVGAFEENYKICLMREG